VSDATGPSQISIKLMPELGSLRATEDILFMHRILYSIEDFEVSIDLPTRFLQSSPIHAHGLVALAAFVGC
jgi:hypothetical protein